MTLHLNLSTLSQQSLYSNLFHAYDIRGRLEEGLTTEFYELLGKAYVTFLGAKMVVVGRDIRPDSLMFQQSLIKGITSMGCSVDDIGEVATEMIYFAAGEYKDKYDGAITVTASHNPVGWNGAKLVGKGASPLSGDYGLPQIKELMMENKFQSATVLGNVNKLDIYPAYKQKVLSFLQNQELPQLKVIVDAGNGIGGKVFDYVFPGVAQEKMYFEPDGRFPNHTPDPIKEENVAEIKERTKAGVFDLGIAIDGDADRVMFIDSRGRNPSGVYAGSLIAKYLLKKYPNQKIVHDPRIIWPVTKEVPKASGIPVVSRAGHTLIKKAMSENNALFGFEMSGHMYYRDFYFADSGMITIALTLSMLVSGFDLTTELDYLYKTYPSSGEVNYTVPSPKETIFAVKQQFLGQGELSEIDGISFEFPDWRFNLRPSNTQPLIRLCVEGSSLELVVSKFKQLESLIGGKRDNQPALKELA